MVLWHLLGLSVRYCQSTRLVLLGLLTLFLLLDQKVRLLLLGHLYQENLMVQAVLDCQVNRHFLFGQLVLEYLEVLSGL